MDLLKDVFKKKIQQKKYSVPSTKQNQTGISRKYIFWNVSS